MMDLGTIFSYTFYYLFFAWLFAVLSVLIVKVWRHIFAFLVFMSLPILFVLDSIDIMRGK